MLVEKPLIGQTVIAPYMKDANNHILFTMTYVEMKFGHIFRVDGIQCHNIGVCSNVVMQKKRNVSRKTSDWPNSYCSVYERCQ